MKYIAVLIILLAYTGQAYPADKWTTQDKTLEAVWIGFHILDWGQTLDIAGNPDTYYEDNAAWIIGKYPSKDDVNIYMGITTILHPLISHILPRKANFLWIDGLKWYPRTTWQMISIGETVHCVANNFSIGLKVKF